MTYSYSVVNPAGYQDLSQTRKKSSLPYLAGGFIAGGAIGAYSGYKKNSITDKNGIKDSFAKKVQENIVNAKGETEKKIYAQSQEIVKKINKIKTAEDLKKFFESNKDAINDMCKKLNQTPQEFLQTITNDNLKANKTTIKNWFEAELNNKLQSTKNKIQFCWDKESKKFVKSEAIKDDFFKAIINTRKKIRTVSVLKYTAIAGAIGAAGGYILNKLTQ